MIINPFEVFEAKSKILGHPWSYTIVANYDCYKVCKGTIHAPRGDINFRFNYNTKTDEVKIIKEKQQ